MSSPSSTTSSMSSASTISRPRLARPSEYRVAEYYDGKVLRIHESRRRQHVTGLAKPSSSRRERPLGAYAGLLATTESASSDKDTDCYDRSNEHESRIESHVTPLIRVAPKAKPIIIQSPMPLRTAEKETSLAVRDSGIPTPPLTPRMQRLATPEIDELEHEPFCDCCVETHFIKFCASCGSEIHPL